MAGVNYTKHWCDNRFHFYDSFIKPIGIWTQIMGLNCEQVVLAGVFVVNLITPLAFDVIFSTSMQDRFIALYYEVDDTKP